MATIVHIIILRQLITVAQTHKKRIWLTMTDMLIIDFSIILWLLKEPFVLAGNPQSAFTCC